MDLPAPKEAMDLRHGLGKALVAYLKILILATAILSSSLGWAQTNEAGFASLFDGKSLQGWHVSAKTGHSHASGNKSGGRWVVENGAIVGSGIIRGITEHLKDTPAQQAEALRALVADLAKGLI